MSLLLLFPGRAGTVKPPVVKPGDYLWVGGGRYEPRRRKRDEEDKPAPEPAIAEPVVVQAPIIVPPRAPLPTLEATVAAFKRQQSARVKAAKQRADDDDDDDVLLLMM